MNKKALSLRPLLLTALNLSSVGPLFESKRFFSLKFIGITKHDKRGYVYCYAHDDVMKWKHFPRSWSLVRGIHRSPVNSPHKGQWRGALMFSMICPWINGWISDSEAGHRAHYDATVMLWDRVTGIKWDTDRHNDELGYIINLVLSVHIYFRSRTVYTILLDSIMFEKNRKTTKIVFLTYIS